MHEIRSSKPKYHTIDHQGTDDFIVPVKPMTTILFHLVDLIMMMIIPPILIVSTFSFVVFVLSFCAIAMLADSMAAHRSKFFFIDLIFFG